MLPTLKPGQLILATGWYGRIRKGDIVVFNHAGLEKIKRVTDIRNGECFIAGDNTAESTDSHDFGWVALKNISGRLLWPLV